MLDIVPLLMLLVFVVFVTLVYLLNEWLYKPLLSFMDNRSSSIKSDLEGIRGNDHEIEVLKAEAERVLANAKNEANAIKEEAQNLAREVAAQQVSAKQSELDSKKQEVISSLEEEGNELRNTLLAQMPLYKESLKAKLNQL
ncbi:F0F1 ATP synthase subunit B' [Helicobacter monodelphidis]|uniref:F0F1 ATP synthase subunit B family protein n=1 Tax=Helicobacter sp. 15-1451 TaxID=2004995 RepID=UPI000DCC04DF|nr:F0F1 ATP synthase subunit B' [Helicobacter sp. 15-1451]RAX56933.1 F0F1 ATP synthase subunit B' [Helicobacter sp. 15-1451]